MLHDVGSYICCATLVVMNLSAADLTFKREPTGKELLVEEIKSVTFLGSTYS